MEITIDSSIQLAAGKLFSVAAKSGVEGNIVKQNALFVKAQKVLTYYNSNGGGLSEAEQQAFEIQVAQWVKQIEKDYSTEPVIGAPPALPVSYQATETVMGIAKVGTQTEVEDINSNDDTKMVTLKKHWQGFRQALTKSWTWQLLQIFATAPRLSSLTASKYLKLDGSKNITSQDIPAADIVTSASKSFVSTSQIASWTAKVSDYVWSTVTAATQSLAVGGGYIMNRGTLITATLPATASVGQKIHCVGLGAGFFAIAQNAGQSIQHGAATTTVGVGGSLTSTDARDVIELICVTANTTWRVINFTGTFTVV